MNAINLFMKCASAALRLPSSLARMEQKII